MSDSEEQVVARPGRCANHPAVALVGNCELCGRPLCIACAVPVRGRLIGPECLSMVLEDAPPPQPVAHSLGLRGDRLALFGFAGVIVLSALPWSRFGDGSRLFGAWSLHWSLVAVLAGVGGLGVAAMARYRPIDPRIETAAYAVCAVVVGAAAVLHYRHPPLLSDATIWPLIAVFAAGVALLGAAVKLFAFVGFRRPPA